MIDDYVLIYAIAPLKNVYLWNKIHVRGVYCMYNLSFSKQIVMGFY